MERELASVSDVVGAIKTTLEFEYSDILVEGEISNLSSSSAGHFYFTLSDDKAALSCALFKMDALRNPFIRRAKNGDKVVVSGPISVYAKRGTFQLITKRISPLGKGDLKAQFELLKSKLAAEGLFDVDRKLDVPALPKKIAVVTAFSGAALQDFLNVLKRRCLWHDIVIVPAVVQGDKCPDSVIKSLDMIEKKSGFDVIVVTRGGGSMEDLWGFNDEKLVRRVSKLKIPVISAIGHQVDYTLLDFVADKRCETPSTAAEFLSQEQTKLNDRLQIVNHKLNLQFNRFKTKLKDRLEKINPLRVATLLQKRVNNAFKGLEKFNLTNRINLLKVNDFELLLDDLNSRMVSVMSDKLRDHKYRLDIVEKGLFNLNPKQVLHRGYTYVEAKDSIITTKAGIDNLESNTSLEIVFHDGRAKVKKE